MRAYHAWIIAGICSISHLRAEPPAEKPAPAPLPDYVRIMADPTSTRLEVASRSFTLPSETVIDLLGVVHIADPSYYAAINARLKTYDAVLFELVGDPAVLITPPEDRKPDPGNSSTSAIRTIQTFMGDTLKLSFQLTNVDYTLTNMVHADTSAAEFQALQKQHNETMLSLMVNSMRMQANGELTEEMADLESSLDLGGLIRIMLSKDSADEFKIILAKMFDKIESLTKKLEGDGAGSAILSGRNVVALQKLDSILKDPKKKRICIFYGAAHMPGMEAHLKEKLAAKETSTTWLAAWTMRPPLPEKPTPATNGE